MTPIYFTVTDAATLASPIVIGSMVNVYSCFYHFCLFSSNQRKFNREIVIDLNPPTAGPEFIRFKKTHIKYHILSILNIKPDLNQQDLKTVNLHFVKSE